MEISEYKNIYQNETKHFFYVSTHSLIIDLLKRFRPSLSSLKILDAGCGTGLLTKKLMKFGEVIGVDISSEAVKYAKKRGINILQSSVNRLPFKNKSFDVIVSVDVLYHKQVNDKKALHEFYRVLKPGGLVILRVAGYNWLRLNHDRQVHTRHRYTVKELEEKLIKAGFTIKKITYIQSLLLPAAIIKSFIDKYKPHAESDIVQMPAFINTLLTKVFLIESRIASYTSLPFGLGIIAVSEKEK